MTASFLASDVGRQISSGGGVGTITGFTDASNVTVTIFDPFPATAIDAFSWTLLGSPQTACTQAFTVPAGATAAPIGTTGTLTLAADGWRAEDVGKFVTINGGLILITAFVSATVVNGIIRQPMTGTVPAPASAWSLNASIWSSALGFARTGMRYQQRLWTAGSPAYPLTVCGSDIGNSYSFLLGSLPTNAVMFTVDSDQANPIMHLALTRQMIALTTAGEFSLRPADSNSAISATNPPNAIPQSAYGANGVPPVRIANELYFAQFAGLKLREMSANLWNPDLYSAPDVTIPADEITGAGIQAMAFQQEPDPLLWCLRPDGAIATFTICKEAVPPLAAWALQTTDGIDVSIATLPAADGASDRLWAICRRIKGGQTYYYVEMSDPDLETDCALTGTNPSGATVWSGFDHLEGRTVQVKGDGVYLGDQAVTGGTITTPRTAFAVEAGLQYVTTVKTLTPEVQGPGGSIQGANLSISRCVVRVKDTIGCSVNGQRIAFRQFGQGILSQPPEPYSGSKQIETLGWGLGTAQVTVQQIEPYDFHLLSVTNDLEWGN